MASLRRPPAVAGMFYPAAAGTLAFELAAMLEAARVETAHSWPKAVIVPHAGYIYSGGVAAKAYALLAAGRDAIRRVVLLGPTHRVWVRGLALPSAEEFDTPLGPVPLDQAAMQRIAGLAQVSVNDAAHAAEHALEVQLPFLQTVLDQFSLVPLAVGEATADEVAEVLEALWGGPETLVVISSDLSHFLPYEAARRADSATADAILGLRVGIDHQQACGGTPVNGLLRVARRRGLRPRLLDLRNSGDTAGGRDRVVGYGAFAFDEAGDER